MVTDVVGPDMRKVGHVEHPYPAVERFVQRLPVRMTGMLQRLGSLLANLVGRHQPHNQGIVLLHPGVACNRDGMGGEQGFTAASRQAQADVRDGGQFGQRCIRPGITPDPCGLLRLGGNRLVGGLRPGETGLLEEAAQRVQRVSLILLQLHGSDPPTHRTDLPSVRPDPSTPTSRGLRSGCTDYPSPFALSVARQREVEGPVLSRVEGPLRPLMFMFPTR